jgi:hypothetical protein
MADHDSNPADSRPGDIVGNESEPVESWYSHPIQTPLSSHHALTKWERRKPENAPIRRWMDLADEAMKNQDAEEEDVPRSS